MISKSNASFFFFWLFIHSRSRAKLNMRSYHCNSSTVFLLIFRLFELICLSVAVCIMSVAIKMKYLIFYMKDFSGCTVKKYWTSYFLKGGGKTNLIKMWLHLQWLSFHEFCFSSVYTDFPHNGFFSQQIMLCLAPVQINIPQKHLCLFYNLRLNYDILFHQIFVLGSTECNLLFGLYCLSVLQCLDL